MSKEIEMSIDPEGVVDTQPHASVAFISAGLAVVGLFALVAPSFVFVSLAAVALGLIVRIFFRGTEISPISSRLATLGILAGLFSSVTGASYYFHTESLLDKKAVAVASEYIEALAKGDRNKAIAMNGLPKAVIPDEGGEDAEKQSQEQKAVRMFLSDTYINMVLERGDQAKWKTTGVFDKVRTGNVIEFQVRFQDESLTNPQPILVDVNLRFPMKIEAEQRRSWAVNRIHPAPL
jgi:hypothetical protein